MLKPNQKPLHGRMYPEQGADTRAALDMTAPALALSVSSERGCLGSVAGDLATMQNLVLTSPSLALTSDCNAAEAVVKHTNRPRYLLSLIYGTY